MPPRPWFCSRAEAHLSLILQREHSLHTFITLMLLWDVLRDASTSLTLEKHTGFLQSHSCLPVLVWHGVALGSSCPLSLEMC